MLTIRSMTLAVVVLLATATSAITGVSAAIKAMERVEDGHCLGEETLGEHERCPTWKEARGKMIHPQDHVGLARQLPRFTMADLELPENSAYRSRRRPFILTDAMADWPMMKKWRIKTKRSKKTGKIKAPYLGKLFPRAVTDFYPYNMLKAGSHPYLFRFKGGLDQVLNPPGQFNDPQGDYTCDEGCRYIHLQLTPKMWSDIEESGDLPKDRHFHTKGDHWWMRRCLEDPVVRDEYHIKTHWKIVLIGSQGAGMFNHSDSLQTSSWHAHVQGEKWWYVCGTNEGRGPREGQHECFENIMQPGEILYYGKNWHHQTQNLDTPTMTITGTVVTGANFEGIADKLHGECYRSELNFGFSSKLCDSLDKCYSAWHKRFKGKPKPSHRWRAWRDLASDAEIAKKEKVNPKDNNYDGRNHIGE